MALTAVGLVVAGAAILVVVHREYTAQAQRQAIDHARVATAAALTGRLSARDLRAPVSELRRRQLRRVVSQRILGSDGLRGSLFNGAGRITFSTERRLIGVTGIEQARVDAALAGSIGSHVVSTPSGRLLRTFLPLAVGDADTRGVFVLDQDYEPIAAGAQRSSLLVAGVLSGLLLALFATLVPVLARAAWRLRAHIDELDHVATHDELTGLPNRRGFRRALEAAVDERRGQAALLMVDLDEFHEINDTLGADSGDRLLQQVATRLRTQATSRDHVARLGEDEFGILVEASSREEVAAIAQKLHRVFAEPFVVNGARIAAEPRIGADIFPERGADIDAVLRRAGVALSVAKHKASTLEIFDPVNDAADIQRLELTAELREAMPAGQIVVHFQPQADFMTRAVRGIEALIRWDHPRLGLLTPDSFMTLAERSGFIGQLDRFVLETAAQQWHNLHRSGIVFDLAVNLSRVDLLDVGFPDHVAATIEQHQMPAEHLVLEITERTLVGNDRTTRQVLQRLSDIGARLAIDDFGTGYSSLAYLYRLPIRQVKLDKTFVDDIPGDKTSEAIIRSTVDLAHTLNATVVAEGVETREQWNRLAALGCDIAQGFLIGRPMPSHELNALLGKRPGSPVLIAA